MPYARAHNELPFSAVWCMTCCVQPLTWCRSYWRACYCVASTPALVRLTAEPCRNRSFFPLVSLAAHQPVAMTPEPPAMNGARTHSDDRVMNCSQRAVSSFQLAQSLLHTSSSAATDMFICTRSIQRDRALGDASERACARSIGCKKAAWAEKPWPGLWHRCGRLAMETRSTHLNVDHVQRHSNYSIDTRHLVTWPTHSLTHLFNCATPASHAILFLLPALAHTSQYWIPKKLPLCTHPPPNSLPGYTPIHPLSARPLVHLASRRWVALQVNWGRSTQACTQKAKAQLSRLVAGA